MNASFAVFESANGAKVFRLPLQAFPNFWAYAYLVAFQDQLTLIDTGSGTDTSHDDLLRAFQQSGNQPSDLTHILLTHAHIDHYGGLTKLKPLTRAKIGCHELNVQTVAHHDSKTAMISKRIDAFLAETGLPEEMREQLLGIYKFTKSLYQSVPVDFTFEASEMRVGALEMIHVPGHCAGHVALRLDDVVFCGDMVVEGVTPHLYPETISPYNGLDHYLDSLIRLQAWAKDALLILNGHDEPIADLSASIDATRQNIIRRMNSGIEVLVDSLTIAEICEAIYGKTDGYNQLLVIEKTGAYVEYLYEHGMIEIVNAGEVEHGKPARYRRVRQFSASELLPKERDNVFI